MDCIASEPLRLKHFRDLRRSLRSRSSKYLAVEMTQETPDLGGQCKVTKSTGTSGGLKSRKTDEQQNSADLKKVMEEESDTNRTESLDEGSVTLIALTKASVEDEEIAEEEEEQEQQEGTDAVVIANTTLNCLLESHCELVGEEEEEKEHNEEYEVRSTANMEKCVHPEISRTIEESNSNALIVLAKFLAYRRQYCVLGCENSKDFF
ncbi:hypothetical protein ACTXT7_010979 [Hymenolepis weldensis]